MAPSSSDQNGAVCTATTLPLNSGISAGAAMALRKATFRGLVLEPAHAHHADDERHLRRVQILAHIADEVGEQFRVSVEAIRLVVFG